MFALVFELRPTSNKATHSLLECFSRNSIIISFLVFIYFQFQLRFPIRLILTRQKIWLLVFNPKSVWDEIICCVFLLIISRFSYRERRISASVNTTHHSTVLTFNLCVKINSSLKILYAIHKF